MRVLVLVNLYPPHALGGYEFSCRDVVERWRQRGHDVVVLTTTTRLPGVPDQEDRDVRRDLQWYWHDHRILRPSLRESLAIERHNRRVLKAVLAAERPDVVSVWAMGAMSLGLIDVLNESGAPTAYVVCDEWPLYGPRVDGWTAFFRRRRGRLLAPAVHRMTAWSTGLPEPQDATYCWVSRYIRDVIATATGWKTDHEVVTFSGIDPRDFPVAERPEIPWRWRLLCVGRIDPRKGFRSAVEALAQLPAAASLQIVGPDQDGHAAELEALAAQLGVRERLRIGAIPRERLREAYAAADVVLFTSAWKEPFGLVPLEAMACDVPVVAAATGGAAEFLVDGDNCLRVEPGDAAGAAAAVRRLADDPALRGRLRAGGRRTAERFSVDRLADVLEQAHVKAAMRINASAPSPR